MTTEPTEHSSIEQFEENLEKSLMEKMQDDDRMGNGSATPKGDSDLAFINMTGLVAPPSTSTQHPNADDTTVEYADTDLDPEAPVSFYEEGIDDVDRSMDPTNVSILDDEEIIGRRTATPTPPPSSALTGLQDIISDLNQDEAEEVTPVPIDIPEEPEPLQDHPEDQDAAASAIETDINDLTNINLQAASDALEELDTDAEEIPDVEEITTAKKEPDVDNVDVSNLIASIDFSESESLLEELESQIHPAPQPEPLDVPVDLIEAQETPDIEIFMDDDTPSKSEHDEPLHHPRREPVKITTIDRSDTDPIEDDEVDTSVYSKPPLPKFAPKHKRRRSLGANILQFLLALTFLAVAVTFAYLSLSQYTKNTITPQEFFSNGTTLLNKEKYRDASIHYTRFATRFPDSILKGDAEFMSAYALHLTPSQHDRIPVDAYEEALIKLQTFTNNNPAHEKTPRAETLMGILNQKLGHHTEAIRILSDPKRRLRDSNAFLPSLRTLARAYAAQSDIEGTRTTYLRAANLDENLNPERDYLALANLYNKLSQDAPNNAMKAQYIEQAITFWNQTLELPGILSIEKRELGILRDYNEEVLKELQANMDSTTEPSPPDTPEPQPADDLDLDSLRLPDTTQ